MLYYDITERGNGRFDMIMCLREIPLRIHVTVVAKDDIFNSVSWIGSVRVL